MSTCFFEGTLQKFHSYMGPYFRNDVRTFTSRARRARSRICELLQKMHELQSAHKQGFGRKRIIEDIS